MKWNKYGQEVEDNDPTGIYDEAPTNPEPLPVDPPPANDQPDTAQMLSVYQQQLIAESNKRAQLERELAEARNNTPKPAPTADDERAFFDKPVTTTREMIKQEVQAAVAPINDFTRQFTRQQTYDTLKSQMKSSGRFPYLEQIEQIFDQAMSGVDPNVNTMTAAYNTALGYYVSNGGSLNDTRQPAPSAPAANPPAGNNRPLPPHARPSAPAAPTRVNKSPVRDLTANEKLIMRHNGWSSPKEYLFWTEHVKPDEVAHLTPDKVNERIKQIFGE